MTDYVVHPSFTDGSKTEEEIANGAIPFGNGEWDEEIPGFWVAKYAAGFQECTQTISSTGTVTEPTTNTANVKYSDKNYTNNIETANAISQNPSTLPKMSYPVFKPLTYAYNCISTGDSYTISQEIAKASSFYGLNSRKTDSHMMKNSEWGAVAYLTQSSYGRSGTEVTINSKNLNNLNSKCIYAVTGYAEGTANGVSASSTNNMSGVFDLSGCVWEYTAAYISNGSSSLSFGSSYVASTTANTSGYKTLSTKYATVYPYDSGNTGSTYNNLKSSTYGFGDSILETSTRNAGGYSWNGDYSNFPDPSYPFFLRGGHYNNGADAGAFAFSTYGGHATYNHGFRAVLVGV